MKKIIFLILFTFVISLWYKEFYMEGMLTSNEKSERIEKKEKKTLYEGDFNKGNWTFDTNLAKFLEGNAIFSGGITYLNLTRVGENNCFIDEKKVCGGEIFSKELYRVGEFSAEIKPPKASGVISSFFLYTSPDERKEIDIEFLGKDTTKIQVTKHYKDNKGEYKSEEVILDLGFDAAEKFHKYAIAREKDIFSIKVEDKIIYSTDYTFGDSEMTLRANVWASSSKEWVGNFNDSQLPLSAMYKNIVVNKK